jgi:hypothetical protein
LSGCREEGDFSSESSAHFLLLSIKHTSNILDALRRAISEISAIACGRLVDASPHVNTIVDIKVE